jgi:hypothetical protein
VEEGGDLLDVAIAQRLGGMEAWAREGVGARVDAVEHQGVEVQVEVDGTPEALRDDQARNERSRREPAESSSRCTKRSLVAAARGRQRSPGGGSAFLGPPCTAKGGCVDGSGIDSLGRITASRERSPS